MRPVWRRGSASPSENVLARERPPTLPTTAVLELTYRCNHACTFCSCPWLDEQGPFDRRPELSIDRWKAVVGQLVRRGVSNIALTGGEPLLKQGFEELVEFAGSLRLAGRPRSTPRLHVLTNGLILDESHLELFRRHDVHVGISLPGLRTFAEHTGAGSPDRVLEAFGRLKALGLRNHVGITVTRKNLGELYETLAEALLAGARFGLLNRFMPGGRGLRHASELALDQAEVRRMLDTAEEVLRLGRRRGSVGTELPRCLVDDSAFRRLRVGSRCSAATGFFVVGPSGWVRVCNHSPIRLLPVDEIEAVGSDPYWRRFVDRRHLPQACTGCEDAERCDGGCREAAHVWHGAVDALDPILSPDDCARHIANRRTDR